MAVISLFFGDLHIASCPEQRQKMFKVLVLVSTIALVSALHGIAVLTPTRGNNVRGVIRFAEIGNTVAVTGSITGLKPNSAHGFHIHEFGYVNVFNSLHLVVTSLATQDWQQEVIIIHSTHPTDVQKKATSTLVTLVILQPMLAVSHLSHSSQIISAWILQRKIVFLHVVLLYMSTLMIVSHNLSAMLEHVWHKVLLVLRQMLHQLPNLYDIKFEAH
jgi:hypothetical protein